ncbi:ATP-binding cassette, subfamily B/ATP-binding cassette, subfamily B, MsbA [Verrucomicrobium sp. GAS474]|uniref:ABC transporter ATP-binding protein n=1 Tax=Verrucomicrobium sp. GAS474 TaxID=1882831 RepID=UPI00087BA112|nr:ABC transporter ATP-binding protein [Verrucomicrobium sp. GAS474]SDT86669.1 ATP-binding cassette, subfamily B/ATP-binding cassette, subfamily B, MsbA [Verrucomicrobium sp. GAS474]
MGSVLRVFIYLRRYPGLAAATLGCALLTTLAGFVFPKVTGYIIDNVIVAKRGDLLLPCALLMAGAFFARDLFNCLRIRFNNQFEGNVIRDLRNDLYDHLQRLPLGWFEKRATGDLMTRVSEDVTNVERVLIDGVEQGIVALLQIVGVGILLFQKNAVLAAWMLLPLPLLFGGALWYTLTAGGRYREQRRAASALNSILLDNLGGIRQIKSFAREGEESTRFGGVSERARQAQILVSHTWALYSPAMNFIGALGTVIVLFVGGRDVLADRFTYGELVEFLLFVGMFYEPVGKLHQLNQLWQSARAAADRVFKIIDTPTERYEPPASSPFRPGGACALPRLDGAVSLRHVGFSYRDEPPLPVLHDINIEVKPGQTVALVGPTGAGKSTLAGLLLRFHEATEGAVLLDGHDVRHYPLAVLRSQIGLVSQENFLFNTTIRENLLFGRPGASEADVTAAAVAAHADEFIRALPQGYDTEIGERGVKLSGGEKQRLAIARALLKDPPILVLDEATASVDTLTEKLIAEALEKLLKNRTSFLVAHRLSTVRRADLILVMKGGRIIERGSHAELLVQGGLYAKLATAQRSDLLEDEAFV